MNHIFTNARILNLSDAEYFAHPAINRSQLVTALREPELFVWKLDNPPESKSMALGSLVHCLVLEPDEVSKRYNIVDLPNRRGNAWKDAVAAEADRITLLKSDTDDAEAMAAECRKHFAEHLDNSHKEICIVATHIRTGLEVKVKADMMGKGWLADLKTTRDASGDAFASSAGKYGYHIQAALYGDAVAALQDIDPADVKFFFDAINSSAPHLTGQWDLVPAAIAKGRADYEQGIDDFIYHREHGWPESYGAGTLSLKPWDMG